MCLRLTKIRPYQPKPNATNNMMRRIDFWFYYIFIVYRFSLSDKID